MKKAFTLIELIVVIGIVSLLIAIIYPAFNAARNDGKQTLPVNAPTVPVVPTTKGL